MIEISAETIERVNKILSGVPKGAEKALSNAMNRGLQKVKSSSLKQVKTVYAVKSGDFNAATRTKVRSTSAGNLAGYVSFSGVKIPLYKFNVTPKVPGTGNIVRAGQQKGVLSPFEHAFIAGMKSGHMGIFERTGVKRFPIEEIMGASGAEMVGNAAVLPEIEKEAQDVLDKRIEHEINRLLNGYGG